MGSPRRAAVPLTDYQRRAIASRQRFLHLRWPRQSGKSFGLALKCVLDVAENGKPWVWLSSGERMSKELIETGAMHARAIGRAAEVLTEDWRMEEGDFRAHVLRFPSGARIIGLPANPATARGHSANVWLDEFSVHKESRAIWRALFPTITRGYRLMVTGTPLGRSNKFYELDCDWSAKAAAGDATYGTEALTIHDCVAQGLELKDHEGKPTTPEALREALADEEAWQQEYLVQFLDEAAAWLSWDQITAIEDPDLAVVPIPLGDAFDAARGAYRKDRADEAAIDAAAAEALGTWGRDLGDLWAGFDVGRRRDLTVLWLLGAGAGARATVAALTMRNQPFAVQHAVLFSVLGLPDLRRACLDRSGLGMQLAEQATARFGEWKAEGVDFTGANKEALAGGLRRAVEDLQVRIPASPEIRNSLHSVKRIPTATGAFRFDAERSEATGHADHFWALALACQAATGPSVEAGSVDWDELVQSAAQDEAHPAHAEALEILARTGTWARGSGVRVPAWMGARDRGPGAGEAEGPGRASRGRFWQGRS